jgi:hypothetical protein
MLYIKEKKKIEESTGKDINKILDSYLETALWTEEENENTTGLTIYDIDEKSKETALNDINEFVSKAGNLLDNVSENKIGHNFWLSRNGHGAGFFDEEEIESQEIRDKLQNIAGEF